jgi:hypothetical protein
MMKTMNVDNLSDKQKKVIISGFLTAWLMMTIYFQEIITLIL